jgi:hypothetical protein
MFEKERISDKILHDQIQRIKKRQQIKDNVMADSPQKSQNKIMQHRARSSLKSKDQEIQDPPQKYELRSKPQALFSSGVNN